MSSKILRVTWLSILLGIGMELILLIAAAGFGTLHGLKPIIADLVQKVSWSFVVCVGLALGTASTRMRASSMGLAGMIAAPAAFNVAHALHKSALQALEIAGPAAAGVPAPLVLALVKAVEYGWLGLVLGWVGKRASGAKTYALIGFGTGLVCAGVIIALVVQGAAKAPSVAALVSRAINEVLFPIGCSLVLFAAETVGRTKQSQ